MSKALLRLAILSAPLILSACGEGWEVQRTDKMFPYGNQRTAGTGVAYVRAKMLPKKELVVEPIMEEMAPAEPVLQADEIFTKAQRKGAAQEDAKAAAGVEAVEAFVKENHSSLIEIEIKTEKQAALIEPAAAAESRDVTITAEEYIAQAPKRIVAPRVEVIKSFSYADDDMFVKTAGVDSIFEESVEIYENEVVQPQKQILVPKKDNSAYLSVGEETLDEIYNTPF